MSDIIKFIRFDTIKKTKKKQTRRARQSLDFFLFSKPWLIHFITSETRMIFCSTDKRVVMQKKEMDLNFTGYIVRTFVLNRFWCVYHKIYINALLYLWLGILSCNLPNSWYCFLVRSVALLILPLIPYLLHRQERVT